MVLMIVGAVITTFAIHHWKQTTVPRHALRTQGIVTEVEVRRSSLSGSSRRLYGPTVQYVDPSSGRLGDLLPQAYVQTAYAVGDHVEVACDPSSGRVILIPTRPLLQRFIPLLFGLGVVALGVADFLA